MSPHVASASVQGQTLPRAAQAVQISLRSKGTGRVGWVVVWFFFFSLKPIKITGEKLEACGHSHASSGHLDMM